MPTRRQFCLRVVTFGNTRCPKSFCFSYHLCNCIPGWMSICLNGIKLLFGKILKTVAVVVSQSIDKMLFFWKKRTPFHWLYDALEYPLMGQNGCYIVAYGWRMVEQIKWSPLWKKMLSLLDFYRDFLKIVRFFDVSQPVAIF